jgi:hypothetical protein
MSGRLAAVRDALALPGRDFVAGLDGVLGGGARSLALVAGGLVAGWWLYVPLHELAHAAGCVAAGGSVTRLDIDPIYGAAHLARIFPFVHPGGEYAGRLSGFDTGDSDLVYLATDLAPFLLTLLPGVWALRRAARRGLPLLFGAAIPFAYAPFVALTGDAFEIGTLAAVHLPPAAGERALVGDDLFRKAAELDFAARPDLAAGFALAAAIAVAWAFAWHRLAGAVARRLGEGALEARSR